MFVTGSTGSIPEPCVGLDIVVRDLQVTREVYGKSLHEIEQWSEQLRIHQSRKAALEASIRSSPVFGVRRNPQMDEMIDWFESTLEELLEQNSEQSVVSFVEAQHEFLTPLFANLIYRKIIAEERKIKQVSEKLRNESIFVDKLTARIHRLASHRAILLRNCLTDLEADIEAARGQPQVLATLSSHWTRYIQLWISLSLG